MPDREYDLLVIGAGIIGSRVALEAAQAGLKVALYDARDFGSATSQSSSKLIHGGLRYLPMGDVGLVRESHRERRALLDRVAPNLVWPLEFLVPIYKGIGQALEIWSGLVTYSALSGFQHSRAWLISGRRARALVPELKLEHLTACGVLEDAQTNDSRLVIATVTAAARLGVDVFNHSPVIGLEKGAAQVQTPDGPATVRARMLVNAAGPWVDAVRRLEDPKAEPKSRLSKGVHVLLPLPSDWQAAVAGPVGGTRVAFALPWEGRLMLGTTDTPYDGDPDRVTVEEADIDQVFREASISLPVEMLRRDRIVFSFAGLRVLELGGPTTAETSREQVISSGRLGMVSVAGGKLTTHRRIAMDVLRRLDDPRARGHRLRDVPLPGSGRMPPRPPEIDPEVWDHLRRHYGSEVLALMAYREAHEDAFERVHPEGPDVWAQVHHAVEAEWATSVEDVVRRRTSLAVRGLATPDVRARIAEVMGLQPSPVERGS